MYKSFFHFGCKLFCLACSLILIRVEACPSARDHQHPSNETAVCFHRNTPAHNLTVTLRFPRIMFCAIPFPFYEVFVCRFPFPTSRFCVSQNGVNLIVYFPVNDEWQGRRGVPPNNVLPQGRHMCNIMPLQVGRY